MAASHRFDVGQKVKATSKGRKQQKVDREMDVDDSHHEEAFKDGGKISRGNAPQRAALYANRKNRSKC